MKEINIPVIRYWSLLITYLVPLRRKVVWLSVALLTSIALQLISPQILRRFIDIAIEQGATDPLITLAVWFLVVGILNQGFSALATYLGADVGWSSTNALREDLASHCLHLDMTFHNNRTPGAMIERIDGDVTALSNFFSQFVIRIVGGALLGLGVLVLLFRESVWVGIALTLFSIVALMGLLRFRHFAVPATMAQRESSAQFFGFIEEMLSGMDDIRANAGGGYVLDRFFRTNCRFFHDSRKAWMLRSCIWFGLLLVFAIADVMAIGLGVALHAKGLVSVGTVFMFFHYTTMLRIPFIQITYQLQDLQNAGASIERIGELQQVKNAMQLEGRATLPGGAIDVVFDHVTFAYGEGDPVIKDLSLSIPAGQILGIAGHTGSGKTTVTRLLYRLYDIHQGRLGLNGIDIQDIDLASLRQRIGIVTQDVQLFYATVRDNLTLFDESVPDERLHEVIDQLGLHDWLARFPKGLDTILQTSGRGLSAGEAQLLAFVRIFLRDPGLIILDEPSSRLDPVTESLLQRAWERLMAGRTGILIAHRLSTISHVETILVLEHGRIREVGPRAELEADPASRFNELRRAGALVEDGA